ncbi:MAG TPA: hypothetical protein VH063_11815 [Gaiellaceae bacterium]|jgi:hypothetical protein|nr:hypothetical protein [Gaiellaceae bacterium]
MSPTATTDSKKQPGGAGIFIALVPWVVFSLLAAHVSVEAAAVTALLASIAIAVPSLRRRRPKTLELAAIAAFAGITIAAFLGSSGSGDWLAEYARAIAAGLLGLIAFGSLLFTPFTEQYARESVPRSAWGSSTFKAVNRKLTITWGLVFVGMIPGHIAAGAIDTRAANLVLNWALPVALVVWGIKRTSALSDNASSRA